MDKHITTRNGYYTTLCNKLAFLLRLTFSDIKHKYKDFPICLIDYTEKDITGKSIDIRFDDEELTVTCFFNDDESCSIIYLFPDKEELLKGFIADLGEDCEYDFIKNRWIALGYYISIRETSYPPHDVYIMFYS